MNVSTTPDFRKVDIPTKDDSVPPFRDLGILSHQPRMNIRLFTHRTTRLNPNLFPEVQKRMGDRRRDRSEGKSVGHREGRREEQRTVLFVFRHVECRVLVDDLRDVV